MGGLPHGSAHARPSAHPPSTWAKICQRICLQLKLSPPAHKKSYTKFQSPRKISTPCSPNYALFREEEGVLEIILLVKSNILVS